MPDADDSSKRSPKWNLSKMDWREIKYVLIAGAIGGFASWVYGRVLGQPVPGGGWAIPVAIFLGAFAAGIGVYVLTNTDTSAVARTVFFAMMCGFVWKPVCDAGKAWIEHSIEQKQDAAAEDAGKRVEEVADNLAKTPVEQLPQKLEEGHDAALAALEALPQARSLKTRREVETKVSGALTMVTQVAGKNPQAVAKVIQNVGDLAAKNQAVKISTTALLSLDRLAETNKAFAPAQAQLKTNIANTVSRRYMLVKPQ